MSYHKYQIHKLNPFVDVNGHMGYQFLITLSSNDSREELFNQIESMLEKELD